VFAKLDPKRLAKTFLVWVDEISETIKKFTAVSIDGKTIRRSRSEGKKAVHIVTAFASELQLVLGQLATDEKSNEITAIPKLLEMFCRKGMVITIDAMGTQTAIAEKIIGLGGEYVLVLKGNHQNLLDDVSLYLTNEIMTQDKKTLKANGMYDQTIEKGHGRIETREYFIYTDINWLDGAGNWAGLAGIGVIISKREIIGKEPEYNRHFFIFSPKDATASDMLNIIRSHWAIENNLHWTLDVLFREDDVRARLENSAENLNILRKQALQLMKRDDSIKASMKAKRLCCAWNIYYALKIIGVN
jgi:predicted transposase YbfD/YdcC